MIKSVMFHSVGNPESAWHRHWLSVSVKQFEAFCKYLFDNKYKTIHLDEWYELENNPHRNNKKTIVLTFDDGYLDNWIYAYPILKKYSLKGTIFINPEFVDPGNDPRPNLDNFWAGQISLEELNSLGYLNWGELEYMDKKGILDVQSHSMSHNIYFCSNVIKDIYFGQQSYEWIGWYLRPERKPFSMTENQSDFIPVGFPVFDFGLSLKIRRYFMDERLTGYAQELINSDPKISKEDIISVLNEKITSWTGRFESDEEMENRYRYEISESKRILEEKLSKKIEFLCWPAGAYNDLSLRLSVESGYKASTLYSRDIGAEMDRFPNYKRMRRFGLGSFITYNNRKILVQNKNFLISQFKSKTISPIYKNLLRLYKLKLMLCYSYERKIQGN